jgi:hypothetical protein
MTGTLNSLAILGRTRRSSSGSRYQVSGDEEEEEEEEDDDDDLEDDDDESYEEDNTEPSSPRERGASDVGDLSGASCATLIISFIHSISSPSFTVRSLYETKVRMSHCLSL